MCLQAALRCNRHPRFGVHKCVTFRSVDTEKPAVVDEWLAIPAMNLGPGTGYPDPLLSSILDIPATNSGAYHKLGHDRFLAPLNVTSRPARPDAAPIL